MRSHQARRLADVFRVHATDPGHALRRVLGHLGLEILEALGAARHEVVIVQILEDQHVHQAVEQGRIGAGLVAQMDRCVLCDRDAPRIGHDERHPALLDRLAQLHAEHRVLLGGVRADDEEALRVLGDILERVRHGPRAEACHQTGDGSAVSEARTMVNIVRLHHLSRQLHDEEVLLVGAASRRQRRERIAAVRLLGLGKLAGDEVQRGVPVGFDKVGRPTNDNRRPVMRLSLFVCRLSCSRLPADTAAPTACSADPSDSRNRSRSGP